MDIGTATREQVEAAQEALELLRELREHARELALLKERQFQLSLITGIVDLSENAVASMTHEQMVEMKRKLHARVKVLELEEAIEKEARTVDELTKAWKDKLKEATDVAPLLRSLGVCEVEHPGMLLREWLDEHGRRAESICRKDSPMWDWLVAFMRGMADITEEYAGALHLSTGISKQLWLSMQAHYDKSRKSGPVPEAQRAQ